MLRSPESLRNLHVTRSAFRSAARLACLALLPGIVAAQDLGTHTLPADLADASAKVLGALNKDPKTNRALNYSEGPGCDAEGNLYFTEDNAGAGNIWLVPVTGTASNFYNGPGMPNGLEFDNAGKLFSAELGGIAKYDKSNSNTRVMIPMNPSLASNIRINDVTIASNGGMFFANHAGGNQFFYRDPTGKVTTYNQGGNLGVTIPNGPEYVEEKKMLLVTGDGAKRVFRFDVKDDGTVSNRTEFATVNEPDGLTLDEKGNVYVASYNDGAIYAFGPTGGAPLGKITIRGGAQGNASNVAFGGADHKTLFITGNGGAYKLQMKVAGRVRPGTTALRPGFLRASAAPVRGFSAGYTLSGRKVDLRKPAALLIVTAPLAK
jgi:gluconolactonase